MNEKRTVRVFISSTFKDMHSERDFLVKYVFPELRAKCLSRGLDLVDVDLRWGVTEEEAERGKALEICLDEAERCRPFFLCLLGERYGWSPPEYEVPDLPQFDWLRRMESGLSVTALEIYQGVLSRPESCGRAYFCFRDNSFATEVPAEKRGEILAENPEAAAKLAKLKDEIRGTLAKSGSAANLVEGYPCSFEGLRLNESLICADNAEISSEGARSLKEALSEGGVVQSEVIDHLPEDARRFLLEHGTVQLSGLEALGEMVLTRLWKAIEQEYPAEQVETDPVRREILAHQLFADTRIRHFIGRQETIDELSAHLDDPGTCKPVLLCGAPGSGKSALMAALAARSDEREDTLVIRRFCGATPLSSELDLLLRSILEELSRALNRSVDLSGLDSPAKLAAGIEETLASMPAGSRCHVLIDAVDQLPASSQKLEWLPRKLPGESRVVISAIDEEAAAGARSDGLIEVSVGPLSSNERREIVETRLWEYRKKLGYDSKQRADQLLLLLGKRASDNPLYLAAACEELRIFPKFEEVTSRIRQLPDDMPALMQQILERLERDHGRTLIQDALTLIEASLHGLHESELLVLLRREGEPSLPPNLWARARRGLAAFLTNPFSEGDGLIRVFHRQLSLAVRERYLGGPVREKEAFSRLADLGLEAAKGSAPLVNTGVYTGVYLMKAGRQEELAELLESICSGGPALFASRGSILGSLIDHVARTEPFDRGAPLVKLIEDSSTLDRLEVQELLIGKAAYFHYLAGWEWSRWLYGLLEERQETFAPAADDPKYAMAVHQRARVLANFGQLLDTMGDHEGSIARLKKALRLREEVLAASEEHASMKESIAYNLISLATVLGRQKRNSEALPMVERAIAFFEEALGTDQRALIVEALVKAMATQLYLLDSLGRPREVAVAFAEARERVGDLIDRYRDEAGVLEGWAGLLNNYASHLQDQEKDYEGSARYVEQALEIYRRIKRMRPDDRRIEQAIASLSNNCAMTLTSLGRAEEAESYLLQALESTQTLVESAPEVSTFRSTLVSIHGNLASLYQERGDMERASRHVFAARDLAEALYEASPSNVQYLQSYLTLLERLAFYQDATSRKEEALLTLARAAALSPSPENTWRYAAYMWNSDLNPSEDCLKLAREVVVDHPEDLRANLALAYMQAVLGLFDDAIFFAGAALAIDKDDAWVKKLVEKLLGISEDPSDTASRLAMVAAGMSVGEDDEDWEDEEDAPQSDGDRSDACESAEDDEEPADDAEDREDYDDLSEEGLRALLDDDPDDVRAHIVLSSLLRKREDHAGALEQSTRALMLAPKDLEIVEMHAYHLYLNDRFPEAAEMFKRKWEAGEDDFEAAMWIGRCLHMADRNDEALRYIDTCIQGDPEDRSGALARAWYHRGLVMEAKEDTLAALQGFLEAVKLDSDFADAHHRAGLMLIDDGQIERSFEHFERAALLDPKDTDYLFFHGILLKRLDRLDDALQVLFRAEELDDQKVEVLNAIGEILLDMENTKQARRYFERALAIDPDDEDASENLRRCRK